MIFKEQLEEAIKKIENAKPCEIHGKEFMAICNTCWETVLCEACHKCYCAPCYDE